MRLVAGDALQLAGLTRAAEEAGLLVDDELGSGELVLRSAGTGPPRSALDVVVEAEHIRLRLDHAPDKSTWEQLRHLIEVLLGPAEPAA